MPEQGDIVLIPVPFTDLSSHKRRPVVVVSNDSYNRTNPDVVVVAMTSRPTFGTYSFSIDSPDLVEGSLNHAGFIRTDKIYTLAKSIVVKRFGRVSPAIVDRIRALLADLTKKKTHS